MQLDQLILFSIINKLKKRHCMPFTSHAHRRVLHCTRHIPSWMCPKTWYLGFTLCWIVSSRFTQPARPPWLHLSPWPVTKRGRTNKSQSRISQETFNKASKHSNADETTIYCKKCSNSGRNFMMQRYTHSQTIYPCMHNCVHTKNTIMLMSLSSSIYSSLSLSLSLSSVSHLLSYIILMM